MKHSSKSRLVCDGRRIDSPEYGLSEQQILTLERLATEPEANLGAARVRDEFDASFFETNFWLMWATTFSFQPWHSAAEFKRYLRAFCAHHCGLQSSSWRHADGVRKISFDDPPAA